MEFGRVLTLSLAIQMFGFIEQKAVFHKDSKVQKDTQTGKMWQLSHLIGCVIEQENVIALEENSTKSYNFLYFSLIFIENSFFFA